MPRPTPKTTPVVAAALLALALPLALGGCTVTDLAVPAAATTTTGATSAPDVRATPALVDGVEAELDALEAEHAARVGVQAIDTGDGRVVAHRADERFGFASTLKLPAAAVLLDRTTDAELAETVRWTTADVEAAGYSPVTGEHVADGLPLGEVAEAAVRQSDNTAMNLVLERLGGPEGLGDALVELGDDVTSVDRTEPTLNDVTAGDPRDTTTPAAFASLLRAVAVDDALDPDDRATLLDWASGNATGDALVRAGAPEGWVVADKSGGAGPIRNDVAVVTPPGRAPIVLVVLTTRDDPAAPYDDALVARTAEVVLGALR
ncbi:class A beta-lactamase [Frigoribacterium salinisoli]